jgi:hypothetical protein
MLSLARGNCKPPSDHPLPNLTNQPKSRFKFPEGRDGFLEQTPPSANQLEWEPNWRGGENGGVGQLLSLEVGLISLEVGTRDFDFDPKPSQQSDLRQKIA